MKKDKEKGNKGGASKSEKQPYKKEIYNAFIEWTLLTTEEKQEYGILTAKAFARKYKIGESRLSKWKKREDFIKARGDAFRLKLGDYTADVLNALTQRCIKYGMAHDVELWLLYVEGWDRKHALSELDKKKHTLAPDDIRTIIEILPKDKQRRFYDNLIELLVEAQETGFSD